MKDDGHMSDRKSPVILLGMGQVGRSLLHLILDYNKKAKDAKKIVVAGIADSHAAVLDKSELPRQRLADALRIKKAGGSLGEISRSQPLSEISSSITPGAIVADVTASDDTVPLLKSALSSGCGVVLANKRPLASAWSQAEVFFSHPYVRYEATVGAGLPVISTLRNLLSCNDSFTSIKGVLSGTLGYMCSEMERGATYSQALLSARDLGYTEPDPREDLMGTDVARKALILTRSVGWPLEPDDIDVESMFPDSLSRVTLDEFLRQIHTLDEDYAMRTRKARNAGMTLRYVAKVDTSGAKVGLSQEEKGSALGSLSGAENAVIFRTRLYNDVPLTICGPGAGPLVTAAGVLGDILDLSVHMREGR
ncbi:MAG TPA: homoserine dehydrogenase [Candidatus Acetothermia bacterium]|nr:homoserine dehydrogenase [Candidatus Acetothermia bacterium]